MKYFLNLMLLLCIGLYAHSSKAQNIVTHQMGDDGYVNVPLQFNFPFYGQLFSNSWMYDNGIVSFVEPGTPGALSPWQWNAQPLNAVNGTYFIATLWADLAPVSGVTSYTSQGNTQYQQYNWNNIAEYYSIYGGGTGLRLNSFSLKIEPSGKISSTYTGVNLQTSSVAIGTVGGPGEYNQIAYHPYGTVLNSIPNWSVDYTGVNPCISNPLISSACPGYAEAYFNQQCTINPLYNSACPGYAVAYFTQQCSLDPLYNTECPGYAEAYAKKYVLKIDSTTTTTTTTTSTTTPTTTVSSDGTVSTEISKTGDSNVDKTITTTTTTTTPTSPAAAVNLSSPQQSTQQAVQNANTQTNTETKTQTTKTETSSSGTKNTTTNTRQSVAASQQAREQVNKATTMEQQIAAQSNVIGVMSFVPGFDTYQSARIIDVNGLALQRQYGKNVVDNRRLGRGLFGASDTVHQEMVNQQYQLGN